MKSWQQRERAQETLAKEVGYVRKPHGGRLRVALAFPNTYWVGMSNLGFQTVYRLFNAHDDVVCERVFLPPKQELAELLAVENAARHARIADAGRRLRRARLLGVVRVGLRQRPDAAAAGRAAALRGRARTDAIRSCVIGGAVTFVNPEPLAPFADVIAAGEGEVLVPVVRAGVPRGDRPPATCCSLLAQERGFYVPSFYEPQYGADGTLAGYAAARRRRTRRCRCARPRSRPPTRSIRRRRSIFTPDTEFGSRFLVEVVRGCANLCRFCWAGYNYLPVRAFPTDRILELAEAARAARRTASASCRSRSATTRTSSGSSRACSRWATASARRRCASTT